MSLTGKIAKKVVPFVAGISALGLIDCGNMETSSLENRDEVDYSFECYIPDENGKPVPRDFSPDYVCIERYIVEIPALPYINKLKEMHPGMSTADILEMINYGKTEMDFVIRATELSPYVARENHKLAENK